jgi:sugar lactone lactonase YvrE
MRAYNAIICAIVLCSGSSFAGQSKASVLQQDAGTSVTAPADAENVRAEIRSLEAVLSKVPDRGALLFLLARRYAHLGELQKALALLRECMALDAGFVPDPSNSPSLRPLEVNSEFRDLLAQSRRRYSPVHKAHVAFTVPAKDLFPEGLTVDASNGLFYMGSMHRQKIVMFMLTGGVSDFVKQGLYDLSPVGGIHVDRADHSVWASTDAGAKHRPELLHFDAQGKLLERYASPGTMPHDFNDLVLRGTREIFTTDTEGHHVYRFDRFLHTFADMKFWRPVFYPNGITLSRDCNLLFVADMLGVVRVDLRTNETADVVPGAHDTLSGVDGLYWYNDELLGVQYGTGEYRVMRWKLSPDGRKVIASEVLEYRTDLVNDPTTGAIMGDRFYFIANTGIYNLEDDKIVDPAKLEPVHIAVVSLK